MPYLPLESFGINKTTGHFLEIEFVQYFLALPIKKRVSHQLPWFGVATKLIVHTSYFAKY